MNRESYCGLKPCPFCGGKAYVSNGKMYKVGSQSWHELWEEENFPATVRCSNKKCGASVSASIERDEKETPANELTKKVKDIVTEKWNRRVSNES